MKKFIYNILLLGVILVGFSSCYKPIDPYNQNAYGNVPSDPKEQYMFHYGSYDVGSAQCWLPGLWDLGVNTRVSDNWNMRCNLNLMITSNSRAYMKGVLSNVSTGTITYYVERPGLLCAMDTKEHFYNVLTNGTQTVNFTAWKYGDGTWIEFSGGIKFFTNCGVVNFAAFNGLYNTSNPLVTKNGLRYYVLQFTKNISGQGTTWDQPLVIEFDYR